MTPDPQPLPPQKPLATDCCESGCEVCVFDRYAGALADYETRLRAWRMRHPNEAPDHANGHG